MKQIPLTQGLVALVDDADFDELAQHKWHAALRPNGARAARTVRGEKRNVYMSRQIMQAADGMVVDHANHDTLDNRRENLRVCTQSQNMANGRKRCGLTSKFKGVHRRDKAKRWQATIHVDGHSVYLGDFEDECDAARAYNAAAHEHFGEFALLNVIHAE